jgi:hypothetical protein
VCVCVCVCVCCEIDSYDKLLWRPLVQRRHRNNDDMCWFINNTPSATSPAPVTWRHVYLNQAKYRSLEANK